MRLFPKGRKGCADYYIDEDTKRHLVELIRFHCEQNGQQLLPVIKTASEKTPPDRYVLQWKGQGLKPDALNMLIQFFLNGIVLQPIGGSIVHLNVASPASLKVLPQKSATDAV